MALNKLELSAALRIGGRHRLTFVVARIELEVIKCRWYLARQEGLGFRQTLITFRGHRKC